MKAGGGTKDDPARPAPPAPLRRLGDFTLLQELGRGGMGVVYKAKQDSMGRLVALKVLPSFAGMDPDAVQRFRREAEAAGRLSHPGIVPIFAVGEVDGVHFFAMELVEGPSLQGLLDSLRGRVPGRLLGTLAEETGLADVDPTVRDPLGSSLLPGSGARYARSCAALCADVASALAAAHQNKVIHRDLKPSNILIRKGGKPVIVDFGLSRDEMAVGLTRSGEAVGTPSYMAPEQARGSKDIDARVDVYGLGATLYEMLALRPPFEGAHAGDIMRKILDEEPPPLRKLNERVPPELETIVEACLQKDPDLRYPAMEALELDLRAFLRGEAVTAKRGGLTWRVRSGLRRQRKKLAIGALALVASAATIATMGVVSAKRDRERGERALDEARTSLLEKHDPAAARESYGRATALLHDSGRVQRAQRDHLRVAFEQLYREGKLDELKIMLATVQGQQRDAELQRMERRIAGVGTLALPEGVDAASVAVRQVRGKELGTTWQPLPPSRELPVGEYLVRVRREGYVDEVRKTPIERDKEVVLAIATCPVATAPFGMLLACDAGGQPYWVGRTELTRGEYARMLGRLDDPDLRDELRPSCPLDGDPDLPVQGLSYRQAALAAALLGGHLPTHAEYLQAASCGVQTLVYPWGNELEAGRVVADPNRCNAPGPATALPEGASPLGVLHLAGNVAEMLVARFDEAPSLAGGHFQSEPRELEVKALPQPLSGREDAKAVAGMRLYRFLAPPDQPEAKAAVARRCAELLGDGLAAMVGAFLLDDDGVLRCELAHAGNRPGAGEELCVPVTTQGFLLDGEPTARVGHGEPTICRLDLASGASRGEARIAAPGQRGERFRVSVGLRLAPVDGLRADGCGYVLRVPTLVHGGIPALHVVTLPRGAQLVSCDPEPVARYVEGGRTSVVFEQAASEQPAQAVPLVVRFRKDGLATGRFPAQAVIQAATRRVFDALRDREPAKLRDSLSRRWQQLPSELEFDELPRLGRVGERYGPPKILDFHAIGGVVTAYLTADLSATDREGREVTTKDWHMCLSLVREGGRWVGLRLAPTTRADEGAVEQGSYHHAQLGIDWSPPLGSRLVRALAYPCEMQVACIGAEGVQVVLLGEMSAVGAEDAEVKLRLSAGQSRLRPGTRQTGPDVELVGPDDDRKRGTCEDWLFGVAGRGGFSRERWILVRSGRRSLLIQQVAAGATAQQAKKLFEESREFFRAASETLAIR